MGAVSNQKALRAAAARQSAVRLPRTHRLRLRSAVITTKAATDTIERVRADHVPAAFEGSDATVLVGGETAFNKGFFDLTDTCTPLIFVS